MQFKINKSKIITQNSKPYIIAEACINHGGNIIKTAIKMIDEAKKAGVSVVKFQFHVLEDEMLKKKLQNQKF